MEYTDARQVRTRKRVIAATAGILRREGYARLTMERVAAESGVAKTTLYRRWPTKAALCMDLYLDISGRELTCRIGEMLPATSGTSPIPWCICKRERGPARRSWD